MLDRLTFQGRIRGALVALMLATIAVLGSRCDRPPSNKLPALGAVLDQTTASGISSGAYMAGQLQLAHSRLVVGVAIIAGGPYGCAESLFADAMPGPGTQLLNLSKAINGCMQDSLLPWGVPNPGALAARAKRHAAGGQIDPIDGVVTDRVYLFSGRNDRTVESSIVAAAAEFYRALGVPVANIQHISNLPAGHAFVTERTGEACERTGAPYVVACNYDQAGALLAHLYGSLAPRASLPRGEFRAFDQREFTRDLSGHGLADEGVVFVPESCRRSARCRIHVAFHGCGQNRGAVGDAFVRQTGYAEWAETNRIVVLFPQTSVLPMNPQGCWDWWGYTGSEFTTKAAPQIVAVKRMLDRLAMVSGG
jgi:hypothetical protein